MLDPQRHNAYTISECSQSFPSHTKNLPTPHCRAVMSIRISGPRWMSRLTVNKSRSCLKVYQHPSRRVTSRGDRHRPEVVPRPLDHHSCDLLGGLASGPGTRTPESPTPRSPRRRSPRRSSRTPKVGSPRTPFSTPYFDLRTGVPRDTVWGRNMGPISGSPGEPLARAKYWPPEGNI